MGSFIFLIIVGAGAGYLATRMMGMHLPPLQTVALGVIGAILGSWIIRAVIGFLGLFGWFIGAFLGVVILIWAYQTFVQRR